jgi:hypothetical protein
MIRRRATLLVVFAATALIAGVLGLYRTGAAAPKEEREPFANAVAQRSEMIALLKDIQAQLKEQNQLLTSGKLTVLLQTEKKEE